MPKLKKIPKFKSEDEEREFWGTHDSCEYIDWSKAKRVTFSKLQPSAQTISLRLPRLMITELKSAADKIDIGYQSLIKVILAEHLARQRAADLSQIRSHDKPSRAASSPAVKKRRTAPAAKPATAKPRRVRPTAAR
jgi:predicted DNA binding CopG/RHH family protein